ncbi:MAG: hypothetical protein HGA22_00070 [Clostridiales bacterium]|nr:hypothetical protein [Clostridiales bacterium]
MSTLLAASGNLAWFEPYLKEIGAAEERDDIFASYSTSPIIDHDMVNGAYEWQYGLLLEDGNEKRISAQLKETFKEYMKGCGLSGRNGFGILTADNYSKYLINEYLAPDLVRFLKEMAEAERRAYLDANPWITYNKGNVEFTFEDFCIHGGRSKPVPSYDDIALAQPETGLYGNETEDARHFTDFGLQLATGDPIAKIDDEMRQLTNMMNPYWHIARKHSDASRHWWIRHGACDSATALPAVVNLAAALENAGADVNCRLIWDGGHCEDDDNDRFVQWTMDITGFKGVDGE